MGLKDFIQEQETGSYDNVTVKKLSFELNESKNIIILSRFDDESEDYEPDKDMVYFEEMGKWGITLKDLEGNSRWMSLPILDENLHDSEKSKNEFFDMAGVLGLRKIKKAINAKLLLWVADADSEDIDNPDVYLWKISYKTFKDLYDLQVKYGSLYGRTLSVRKPSKRSDSLVVQPFGLMKKGSQTIISGEPFDVSTIEFPNSIRDNIYYQTLDSQVRFMNTVKESYMNWMEREGYPIDEWFFTIDDEKGNGVLKPKFMTVRSDEFEV